MAWNVFLGLEVFFTAYQAVQENTLTQNYPNQTVVLAVTHYGVKHSPLWGNMKAAALPLTPGRRKKILKNEQSVWVSELPKDDGSLLDSSHTSF